MFLVWLPCQRKELIKIFFRVFTVWMLKVGASRLSLVEIYVHGYYHVWIRAGVSKVKERTTLTLQKSFTKWCRADVWWLFLVAFLIDESLLGKIRTTKRHGLERTTWKMATWNGGKRVRRHTATIATSPNTMVKYWQRHAFFFLSLKFQTYYSINLIWLL